MHLVTSASRPHGLRTTVLAALTAALVLASAGVALAHGSGNNRGRRGLTGTVAAVSSTGFTVTTRNDKVVTVATTAATTFLKTAAATVAGATVGSYVAVKGSTSDSGAIAAKSIHIKPAPANAAAAGVDGRRKGGRAAGTVASNNGTTLTITTAAAGTVTVTTTADTKVSKTTVITLANLAAGDRVKVKGTRNEDGTVTARTVHVVPPKPVPAAAKTTSTTAAAPARLTSAAAAAKATTTAAAAAADAAHITGNVVRATSPTFVVAGRKGQTTVATTAGTAFIMTSDATLADATVGSAVSVFGHRRAGGVLTAVKLRIHAAAGEDIRDGFGDDGSKAVSGSVTAVNAGAGTLTLATADGSVSVQTGPQTRITKTAAGGSFALLAPGVKVKVDGVGNADGTVTAARVHIDATTGRLRGQSGDHDNDAADANDRGGRRDAAAGDRRGGNNDNDDDAAAESTGVQGSRDGGGALAGSGGGRGSRR